MASKIPPSPSEGISLLARADVRVRVDDERHIFVTRRIDSSWKRARVRTTRQSPGFWEVERDLANAGTDSVLYVVRGASPTLTELASSNHRIIIADLDENSVLLDGVTIFTTGHQLDDELAQKARRGRVPWARYAIVRSLTLSHHPQTQVQLAALSGVTQAAVSQVLSYLGEYVERRESGWQAKDIGPLFDLFMDEYPGPGGLSSYWLSTSSPREQAIEAGNQADLVAGEISHLISGDVAVDEISPWRRPTRALVYLRTGLELKRFVEVDPIDASLELRVPADKTIWATASMWQRADTHRPSHSLVDPLIASWDSLRTGASDSEQAILQVKRELMARNGWGRS